MKETKTIISAPIVSVLFVLLILILGFCTLSLFVYRQNIKDAKDKIFKGRNLIEITSSSLSNGQVIVTEMKNHKEIFIEYMKNQGWEYQEEEQMGSKSCFQNQKGEKRYFLCYYCVEFVLWIE